MSKENRSQTELLRHQNSLLRQRNQLLEQENQQLLQQLEQQTLTINQLRPLDYKSLALDKEQLERTLLTSTSNVCQAFKQTQVEDDHLKVSFQLLHEFALTGKTKATIQLMAELFEILLKKLQSHKVKSKSSKLQVIEDRLRARQQQRKGSKAVQSSSCLLLIKDPTNSITALANPNRFVNEDFQYVKKFYQTLIMHLQYQRSHGKGKKITTKELQKLFQKFSNAVQLRWKVKQTEADLALIEREYEMGNIGECVINEAVGNLETAMNKIKLAKSSLEREYNDLIF